MKYLLLLMLLLSLFVGLPINGGENGWVSLYGFEFGNAIDFIEMHSMNLFQIGIYILLLCTHLAMLSLFIFVDKRYFETMLFAIPFAFITLYAILYFVVAILLIPFAIIWIISLVYYKYNKERLKIA